MTKEREFKIVTENNIGDPNKIMDAVISTVEFLFGRIAELEKEIHELKSKR